MNFFLKNFTIVLIVSLCGINAVSAQELSQNETEKSKEIADETKEQNPIFQQFVWLQDHVQLKKCDGEKVDVYVRANNKAQYVFIEKDGIRKMYDKDGNLFCTNSKILMCEEHYELNNPEMSWTCGEEKKVEAKE